ncbi:restriction endonuclease subunit S [Xanthobacter versatilis]|uniref:restriction endonuclease subunit S n=1 Tax=Xanthobacter autotrophicus (strain ATCC BAA-1158 / Py2) TaxID=78245 RepID=UPI0037285B5C
MSGLPKGWVEAKIGDVCSYIQRGKSPKYTEKSELPIINQRCIRWWGIDERYLKFIDPEQWSSWTEERFLVPGDVLWNSTGTGTIGRAALFRGLNLADRVVVDSHVTILRPGGAVTGAFLHRFIQSPSVQSAIRDMQSGTTNQVELNRIEIIETTLPLPPLAEQKRIVAKLDALSAKSARARTELARIETLVFRYKQAVLSKAFSGELTREWRSGQTKPGAWKHLPLSQLVSDGPSNGWSPKADGKAGDLKSLKLSATSSGALRLDESTIKYLDQALPTDSKFWLLADDILIQRANSLELLGTTVLFDGPSREFIFPDLMMRIRADDKKVLPPYLATYLNSEPARAYFRANATGTAGNMPKINGTTVRETLVPTAPLDEQHEIVRRIESAFAKIDRLAGQAKRALELVGKLDEAILAKAFRGELVPQDENDEPADRLLTRIRAEREQSPKGRKRPVERKITMRTAKDFLNAKIPNWPNGGISFQDLRNEFSGSYDELKEAVFQLLSEEHAMLQQVFDEKRSAMMLRRREQ